MTSGQPCSALLTPPGRGAVATVGVRGPRAAAIVGRCFTPASGRPLEDFTPGRVVFGRFKTSAASEELVVGLVAEDEVEVHCHGGRAAAEALLAAFTREGCRTISWQEWTSQNDRNSLAAAAGIALADARTERTAVILLDQYRGALPGEIELILQTIDLGQLPEAQFRTGELAGRAEFGRHLTQPWKVALVGKPNAGKSSLINAILGYERSIVFAEPGTTRDVLTAATALAGWPVELADTAGLCVSGDPLEAEGVARARRAAEAAEAVLLVADTTAPWDEPMAREIADASRRLVIVHNKCDLVPPPADGRPEGLSVSALTGAGIDALCQAVAAALVPEAPSPGAAVSFTDEQIERLARAAEQLQAGDALGARQTLMEMLAPAGGRSSC